MGNLILLDSLSIPSFLPLVTLLLFNFSTSFATPSTELTYDHFLQCLVKHTNSADEVYHVVYNQTNPSYISILRAYIHNARFNTSSTPKPLLIVTPLKEFHVQATVICAKSVGIQIKIRSGGHDYEGISYTSNEKPFIVLDMFNFQKINVDIQNEIAFVQAGAILGELYYKISERSNVHAFPAGACPTIGVGGHISGGGYGIMLRKFGLTVDHLIDAEIVDVNGKLLNRKSTGEDLFWAISGSGGASFGVIISYTVKLVRVPVNVTVFVTQKTLEENATDLVLQWQMVAPYIDNRLFLMATLRLVNSSVNKGQKTITSLISGLFLGGPDELVSLLDKEFPLLGLKKENCTEMSWIESVLWWVGNSSGTPLGALLDRNLDSANFLKRKSDYVQKPTSRDGFELLWKKMIELGTKWLSFSPYGGRMSGIPANATPFPHRSGNLFEIQYFLDWMQPGAALEEFYLAQTRSLYNFLAPFVSKKPRSAFQNYRDLEIGINHHDMNSYMEGKVYGLKYFNNNFYRLVKIKTTVDPENFFWHEQSIPTSPRNGEGGKS